MKRTFVSPVALILAFTSSLAGSFAHCIYDAVPLDGAWEMAYRSNAWDSAECPSLQGHLVRNAVPGHWEDMVPTLRAAGITDDFRVNPLFKQQTHPIAGGALDTTLPNLYGCFLYRRRVSLDRIGPAVIAFEGVRNQVHVWANGAFVAFRQGFSTPFELTLPEGALRKGENEIVMAVSNNPNEGCFGAKVSGLTTRGLFASTGGIEGHVELRLLKSALADVHVTTAKDLKSFTVHMTCDKPVSYTIMSPSGAIVAKGETAGDFTLPTDGMALWSPEDPARYTLHLTTPKGTYSQKFGLRRLVADGERLLLNKKPVYLRGVTEHCYFPETVHLPRDLETYRRITARRKELGFNFVRFHTYVPPAEYLEAMDELGMMVHVESPNFVTVDEYRSIVAFARRHPSVVIFCTGNETRIDRKAESYLKDIANIVHSGTDALFSPMSAMRGVEYILVNGKDDISVKPFRHNPNRMKRLAGFCDLFTSYQLGAVSYNSLNGPSAETLDAWGDAYLGRPRLSHEICIDGSYADLSLESLYPKGSSILATGLFSGIRSNLERRGLLSRADIYHRNSCEWMWRIRKFTFEKMRSSRRTAGYDFLGDVNTHWHTFGYFVGMMDEFLRLKPGETVENVLRYNSAAVVLSNLGSDFNVIAGTRKCVKFSISNYADNAKDATVRISLVDLETENEAWGTENKIGDVPCGDIADLGEFDVPFPASEKPKKYLLRAKFCCGSVKAANEWEIYSFPDIGTTFQPSRARVFRGISLDDLLAAMERGERVLLLGTGPFKSLPTTYRIGLAGRCSGNYATVIKAGHPALAGMPHEGFCGWQFRRLMEGGRALQLEADVPFDPIVDVASSEKCPIRQAALFEYRVGEGRLLVCSFAFKDSDPAAVWLKRRLIEYADSDKFEPNERLTVAQLRAVSEAPLRTGEANSNKARNPNDPSSLVRAGANAEP